MLNRFFLDNDYNVILLSNMQNPVSMSGELLWDNQIIFEIDADDTPNQYLEITCGEVTTTLTVTPSEVNELELSPQYWNYEDYTYIQPYKNGVSLGVDYTIDIKFPAVITNAGMISSIESDPEALVEVGQHYEMSGSEYAEEEVKEVKEAVSNLSQTVAQQGQELGNKQNFIDQDILPPSQGVGEDGDLKFQGGVAGFKRLYRNDGGTWSRVKFIDNGTSQPSGGKDGDIYFQTENGFIIGIFENVDDVWYPVGLGQGSVSSISYSTLEQDTGLLWIDGKHIYQKTIAGNAVPSNGSVLISNVDELVNCFGSQLYIGDQNYRWFNFPYDSDYSGPRPELIQSTHELKILCNRGDLSKFRWTFQYTKITI